MLTSTSAAPGSVFVSCLCAGCTVRPLDRLHRDGGTVLSLDRWIEHVSGVACGAGDLATALDIVAVRQQQATEVAPLVSSFQVCLPRTIRYCMYSLLY